MKTGRSALSAIAAASALCFGLAPALGVAQAQTKPAESTTKVKKVLLYNKIGGWVHTDGIRDIQTVLPRLAAAKGFQLTQLADEGSLTLDFLKTFQVIVWNNNTNGSGSVPSVAARQAILNYVNQGGGWLLLHGAGDHGNTWTELTTTLGNTFTRHGNQGPAEAVIDPDAKAHKELKWMVEGLPAAIRLTDEWYSFQRTVRPLSGVTVVATARAAGTANVIVPLADGSTDLTYIWAREVGQGRLLYNAIGHGQNQLMAQQDSIVPKMYWDNLRYAAGDFQNGCTNANASNFNPAARVNDGSCQTSGVLAGPSRGGITVSHGARKTRLTFPHSGNFSVQLRDVRGSVVWQRVLIAGTDEIVLDPRLQAGVYQIEARNGRNVARERLVLP